MARKILVTGADGFIGSHLVEALSLAGEDVRAFVLYNSFNSWGWLDESPEKIKNSIEIISGDIRDPEMVRTALKGCDVVLHLAALISIPFSYQAPQAFIETNVTGTLNVLQAARALGTERVIHTSTSEVYGSAQFVPISEHHPIQPQSPYSASKIAADCLAESFYRSFESPVITVRPFNTYGPRQSARAVIPAIIAQLASGVDELKLGALAPTRDFSFVDDTVNGFIAASKSDLNKSAGQTFNLGSGFEISIGETANLIRELMSSEAPIFCDEERIRPEKSEVDRLYADNSKAIRDLDWQPTFGGLDGFKEGLQKTIDWFTVESNLSRYKALQYNV